MAQQLGTNTFCTARWIVDPTLSNGTHSTIQAAITSAAALVGSLGPQTVFIRTGTYTENLTLSASVNLCAHGSDDSLNATGSVIINGTSTFTTAGSVTLFGIQLQTNSAAAIAVTGSAASILNINNCYLNFTNATGITFSSSSSSAMVNLNNCKGNLGTTGIAYFADSSAGQLKIFYCDLQNSGASLKDNTKSAGLLTMQCSTLTSILTYSSSNTGSSILNSDYNTNAINVTPITTSGTGVLTLQHTNINAGSASAISVGVGTNVGCRQCVIFSSAGNAITGAGTFTYSGLSFSSSSSTINASTQVVQTEGPSRTIGSANSGATNTLTVTNTSNTASSSANILSTVGGTTAADATFQAVVSGTTTWTWGVDNSVTSPTADPWVLAQGTALGTNNVMSVATSGEINYPLQPSFFATASAVANVTGDNTAYTVIFDTEIFDQNGDFDGTSTFTAPVTGRYRFDVKVAINGLTASHTGGSAALVTSNRTVTGGTCNWGAVRDTSANLVRVEFTGLVDMDAADTATSTITVSGGTKVVGIVSGYSFAGDLNE